MRSIVFALLAAASFSVAAGSVDVNLSNDTIEARLNTNAGAGEWTFGILYNRDQKDRALNVGLLAVGQSSVAGGRFEGGMGGKLYSAAVGSADVAALALGLQARWFPGNGPFAIGGYAFYAPRVVTMMDGRQFFDVGVRAEVELMRNSFLYVGYRQVQAELDNNVKVNVDKGGFIGMQIMF